MQLDMDDALKGFPRRVPVFPLAGVVLFPGALLPLHIFEPRYRTMVDDALAGDRLISLGLLKQCSPEEYESEPPFHDIVCVGQIVHHEPLDDGCSNIALIGLSAARAQILGGDKPYSVAQLDLLSDRDDSTPNQLVKLGDVMGDSLPGNTDLAGLRDQLSQFWSEERLPSALVNTCALTAPVFPVHKLELLEERSLSRRAERLIELIERPWQWN